MDFHAHTKDFHTLIVLILLCIVLPNSVKILNSVSVANKKQSVAWSAVLCGMTVFLLVKMIVVPYSEFIYFNF
jgi:hypothetical protein